MMKLFYMELLVGDASVLSFFSLPPSTVAAFLLFFIGDLARAPCLPSLVGESAAFLAMGVCFFVSGDSPPSPASTALL